MKDFHISKVLHFTQFIHPYDTFLIFGQLGLSSYYWNSDKIAVKNLDYSSKNKTMKSCHTRRGSHLFKQCVTVTFTFY